LKKGVDKPIAMCYYIEALERDGKNKARKGSEKTGSKEAHRTLKIKQRNFNENPKFLFN